MCQASVPACSLPSAQHLGGHLTPLTAHFCASSRAPRSTATASRIHRQWRHGVGISVQSRRRHGRPQGVHLGHVGRREAIRAGGSHCTSGRSLPARHPNVVRVFGGGRCPTTGYLYLIMELVRGTTNLRLTPSFPREMVSGVIGESRTVRDTRRTQVPIAPVSLESLLR